MMNNPTIPLDIKQCTKGVWSTEHGSTPVEMPVMLTVNGEPWLEFMCTPEYLEALAVGFLFNEGLIESAAGIAQLYVCPVGDNVDVWTAHPIKKPVHWCRTSGCAGGITAAEDILDPNDTELHATPPGLPVHFDFADVILTSSQINDLVLGLFQAQRLHRQSGGIHASALSDGRRLLLSCEDIGRHNTLDKLAGRVLLENIVEPRRAIVTTGRISSEMLQKAARIGIAVVVSFTAPTSLAVQLADQWGMTLIGYAHGEHFKVYSHPERIVAR
jgi:FdhD protein